MQSTLVDGNHECIPSPARGQQFFGGRKHEKVPVGVHPRHFSKRFKLIDLDRFVSISAVSLDEIPRGTVLLHLLGD